MDANLFKAKRDSLLKNDITFEITTDENYSYRVSTNSGNVFFDDDNNVMYCIAYESGDRERIVIIEYDRILSISVIVNRYSLTSAMEKVIDSLDVNQTIADKMKEYLTLRKNEKQKI